MESEISANSNLALGQMESAVRSPPLVRDSHRLQEVPVMDSLELDNISSQISITGCSSTIDMIGDDVTREFVKLLCTKVFALEKEIATLRNSQTLAASSANSSDSPIVRNRGKRQKKKRVSIYQDDQNSRMDAGSFAGTGISGTGISETGISGTGISAVGNISGTGHSEPGSVGNTDMDRPTTPRSDGISLAASSNYLTYSQIVQSTIAKSTLRDGPQRAKAAKALENIIARREYAKHPMPDKLIRLYVKGIPNNNLGVVRREFRDLGVNVRKIFNVTFVGTKILELLVDASYCITLKRIIATWEEAEIVLLPDYDPLRIGPDTTHARSLAKERYKRICTLSAATSNNNRVKEFYNTLLRDMGVPLAVDGNLIQHLNESTNRPIAEDSAQEQGAPGPTIQEQDSAPNSEVGVPQE